MRLLHTATLEFEEFIGGNIPPYAILSHTWEDKEVTYQDFQIGRASEKKTGYEKIKNSSDAAAKAGFEYIWIDTCCIDKTNNVELTEAINSMYHWYREAKVCFAYMVDICFKDDLRAPDSCFSKSKWFARGWTLQELIAPSKVIFFARDWTKMGTKNELSSVISSVTSIPVRFLLGDNLGEASIAQRMSWASRRKTTKVEDLAYCMLGIFDVHMPLIYGERENAFRRLQEEIMKVSDDQSIFAWTVNADANAELVKGDDGLLAYSPTSFRQSGNIIKSPSPPAANYLMGVRTPFVFNNKGLHLVLPLIPKGESKEFLAILGCTNDTLGSSKRAAIWLRDISTNGGRYIRFAPDKLEMVELDVIRHYSYQEICAQFNDGPRTHGNKNVLKQLVLS